MIKWGMAWCMVGLLAMNARGQTGWADSVMQRMTLEEKIGQLFMLPAYSNKNAAYEKELVETVAKYRVGGVIFFQGSPTREALLTNRLQETSRVPLLVGMDAEGGVGWRIQPALEFPSQTLQGAVRDTALIRRVGEAIGEQCRAMGIHVNFAPVVDINVNPRNPVIGIRSFGERKREVSTRSLAFAQGLASRGVMAVAKHFPGHGDTDVDSHVALPVIHHTAERLDSVELYPFRQMFEAGVPGVMVGHLNVPSIERRRVPASLSREVVTGLLREQLHFKGLCFTDALNMKGVTHGRKPGEADAEALIAGNDICLQTANIAAAIQQVKEAVESGRLPLQAIEEKCRRVLQAKERYVLPYPTRVDTTNLVARLNTPTMQAIRQEVFAEAITLVKNKKMLLPLTRLDTLRIASLNFGRERPTAFERMLERYAPCAHFSLQPGATTEETEALLRQLTTYNCVIIYNGAARNTAGYSFGASKQLADLIRRLEGKHIIFCHPAIPYGADLYSHLPISVLLISYAKDTPAQEFAAQAIFGGIRVDGKLPVSINLSYPAGYGLSTPKVRLGYHLPEASGMNSACLQRIDSLCLEAIRMKATPGCQVLVAKDGFVVYNKAFGHYTYEDGRENRTDDVYDIASLTKITATLPAVMMLVDRKTVALDTPIGRYDYDIAHSNKRDLTIRELLLHASGLKASLSFFNHAIDWESFTGRLFSSRYSKTHNMKLRDHLYINPRFRFRDSTFRFTGGEGWQLVSPHFYVHERFQDSIHLLILESELLPRKTYQYSDLGFVLLKDIVESRTGEPFDIYCRDHFYRRLGAYHTTFNPHRTMDLSHVVPSSEDKVYRRCLLWGYVHDPTAALLGGVAGHAGLFSSAEDIAKIMCTYLQHGQYGGERYIDSATVARFTCLQCPREENRRGLGFDKPDPDSTRSPACPQASPTSYGHTGFTGTLAWNDPEHQLIYIFLSNRTYPNEFNTRLAEENIRTRVQECVYEALPAKEQAPLHAPQRNCSRIKR